MGEKSIEIHPPNSIGLVSASSQGITLQTLAHTVEAAKRSGVLFLFAVHIKLLLETYQEINGPPTTVEMEMIIDQAARAMLGD